MCKYFVNILSKGWVGGYKLCGLARIYFTSSYITKLPCFYMSLANLAIGSVQSMAVVLMLRAYLKKWG